MTAPGAPDPRRREPLWDRVDRNRWRLLWYLVLFTLASSLPLSLMVTLALGALALVGALLSGAGLSALSLLAYPFLLVIAGGPVGMWVAGVVAAVCYEWWALTRDERWALRRLEAELVPKGELLDIKMTVKDMAIAAGMDVAPALYLLPNSQVNAFIFAAPRRRPVLGVTRGAIEHLSLTELRAVFANLVARAVTGDTMVASAMTALMTPLYAWREQRLRADDGTEALFATSTYLNDSQRAEERLAQQQLQVIGLLMLPALVVAVFLGEVLAAGHREAQQKAAMKADMEGMLLLRDPTAMRSALESSIRRDNVVAQAGESMAELFWFWTGDSTDDDDDPQWSRVARLREIGGVEGMVDRHVEPVHELLCPPAPRLDDASD